MAKTITDIKVYWDVQDPSNEGWAYVASNDNGLITSGGVDADSLDDAIDEAIFEIGVDLTHDDFARHDADGGCGIWTSETFCPAVAAAEKEISTMTKQEAFELGVQHGSEMANESGSNEAGCEGWDGMLINADPQFARNRFGWDGIDSDDEAKALLAEYCRGC